MKYKNTSGFRQVLMMDGKKCVVFPDDVVEVSRELINAAFEQVEDDAEVTYKARTIKKPSSSEEKVNFSDFENKIDEVKKQAEVIAKTKLSEAAKNTDVKLSELQASQANELSTIRSELTELKSVVFRRLEILKSAVKTLEYEVGQLYSDEEVDEEQKPFQK